MENKSFISYVAESKKEYKYVLKFALHDMTDGMIDTLEECLKKYELKNASSFRKTPIQANPLDFPNVKNCEVYICDIELGYPASLDFLRTYICNCLDMSPALLAVYSHNDPRQIETDLYVERTAEDFKKNYKTTLGSDYESTNEPAAFGDKYNVDFLKELEKVRKERENVIVTNALSQEQDIDHSTLTKGYDEFNAPKNRAKDDVGLFGRIKKPNLRKAGIV